MSIENNILSTAAIVDQQSADSFLKSGIPSRKNEEYKFTDIKKIIEKRFSFQASKASNQNILDSLRAKMPDFQDAYHLVYINGSLDSSLSNVPDTLHLTKLTVEAKSESKVISSLRSKSSHDFTEDSMQLLNTALAGQGHHITVKAGQVIEKPVYLIYLSDATVGESYTYPKLIIEHGENSQAKYVEITLTDGSNSSLINASTEIYLDRNAVVDFYSYQNDTDSSVHVKNTAVYQETNSNFSGYTLSIGGGMIRNNLNIALVNEHIESNMYGLYMLQGNTHVDNHTVVDHQYPNCLSNELYKGVLDGQSRGVFNGKIFVRQDAQQTNAFQSNNNIVISDKAVVNTKPQLEIC